MHNEEENNEIEILKKLAPTLFSMEKVNNLKAPEGYFQNLSHSIERKINNEVPTDYFETLADKVMEKIEAEKDANLTAKIIPLKRNKWVQYFAVAASVAAIVSVFIFLENKPVKSTQITLLETQFEDLTIAEFEDEMYVSETEDLFYYVDFEENEQIDRTMEYDFYETNLEMTSDEMDEYLSSDYYLDVEF